MNAFKTPANQSAAEALLKANRNMSRALSKLSFDQSKVTHVYDPFQYAWQSHKAFVEKFAGAGPKKTILLGMNPGPWGMAQTGVPFGEVGIVRDWLKIDATISRPQNEHSKRQVLGLDCKRSEVSGSRLWGALKASYKKPERYFADHFICAWCPLLFLEESGRNFTPTKFRKSKREELATICDARLAKVIDIFEPEFVIGVGSFAEASAKRAALLSQHSVKVGRVLHPSPASPKTNAGWAKLAQQECKAQGIPLKLA